MIEIALYIVASIATFFLWLVIHEMAHILMAKIVGDVKDWSITPYPHKYKDRFRFAGANWTWDGEVPSLKRQGLVSLAPMIPSLFVISLTWIALFLTGVAQMLVLIFCTGAIVNLIKGAVGWTEFSDLIKGTNRLGINKWIVRIGALTVAAVGVAFVLASLFGS